MKIDRRDFLKKSLIGVAGVAAISVGLPVLKSEAVEVLERPQNIYHSGSGAMIHSPGDPRDTVSAEHTGGGWTWVAQDDERTKRFSREALDAEYHQLKLEDLPDHGGYTSTNTLPKGYILPVQAESTIPKGWTLFKGMTGKYEKLIIKS